MSAIRKYRYLYLMMVPVIVYFLIYSYYPLLKGLIISFQDYKLIGNRPFIGFANYKAVLADPEFLRVFVNTIILGGGMLIIGFFAALAVALLLNEVFVNSFKKTAQMVLYIPHLLSWVVVGGMWIFLLSPDTGIINLLLDALGRKPIPFLSDDHLARWTIILIAVWKDMGYTCILFLAGIASINPALYETARIDGASRWQQIRYVTIPQLYGTMKVVFLLNTLGILRIFDPSFILGNPETASKVNVLMVYTYDKGIVQFKIGFASAASFFVVILTFALTLLVRWMTRFDEV